MTAASFVDRVVDPLTGPLLSVVEQHASVADEPVGLHAFTAVVSDLQPYLSWSPDLRGSGFGFDREAARAAAVGEACERYCGNFPAGGQRRASYRQLTAEGEDAVDPGSIYPFRPGQNATVAARFTVPSATSELGWLPMTAVDGRHRWVPAALVVLNYYRSVHDEPRHFPVQLPGIACGQRRSDAVTAAVLEILERDATALWWHGGHPARLIPPTPGEPYLMSPAPDRFTHASLLLRTYDAGATAYVVAHLLHDLHSRTIQLGFACRFHLRAAVRKAAAEAWQLRRLNEWLLDPDSRVWRTLPNGSPALPTLPFNPDRDYRRLARAGYADMTQLVHNLQYHLDLRHQRQALDLAAATAGTVDVDLVPRPGDTRLDLARLAARERLEVCWTDLTTPDVADLGLHVVRAFSPEACPNLAAAFTPLANRRLQETAGAHNGGTVRLTPMPHA
jgi:ribosomal protein S12 methylthiotransferase accessory factor